MTKAQLVSQLTERTAASRKQVDDVLDAMIETVVKTVKRGESVKIPGLGILRLRRMKASRWRRRSRRPSSEGSRAPARSGAPWTGGELTFYGRSPVMATGRRWS